MAVGVGLLLAASPVYADAQQDANNYTSAFGSQLNQLIAVSNDFYNLSKNYASFSPAYYKSVNKDCNALIQVSKEAHLLVPPRAYAKSHADYLVGIDEFHKVAMLLPKVATPKGQKKLDGVLSIFNNGVAKVQNATAEMDSVTRKNGWAAGQ